MTYLGRFLFSEIYFLLFLETTRAWNEKSPPNRAGKEKKKESAAGKKPLVHILYIKRAESNTHSCQRSGLLFAFDKVWILQRICVFVCVRVSGFCQHRVLLIYSFLSISNPQLWKGKFYYGTLACALSRSLCNRIVQKKDKIYCESTASAWTPWLRRGWWPRVMKNSQSDLCWLTCIGQF